MMDKLPPELLHKIFIQLDLEQRLICLTVCRSWWTVLNRYSLFYNVSLRESNKRFKRFIEIMKQWPGRATQAEEIQIRIESKTSFNRRKLFNIFPNARVIKIKPEIGSWNSPLKQFKKKLKMTHSKAKVEYLSDFGHCELASQLLGSNLGGQLGTLCLDFQRVSGKPTFISQLKNLPVLKKFSLKHLKISLHDLETIHENIPSIQDLTLHSVDIETGYMPSNIEAATSITKFDLSDVYSDSAKMHAQFYKYMAKKYTNITEFKYSDEILHRHHLSDRKYIYLNGVLDFFKGIDWSQNKLTLYGLPDDVDIFQALDSADTQIKNLLFWMCEGGTIFQYLSQSNQSKHVETLVILNTSLDSIDLIKNMTALTSLDIRFYDPTCPPINLASCLYACPPSLKALSIGCSDLIVEPFKKKLNSIETLRIGFNTITSGLGEIISSCFPNMVKLDLTGGVTEDATIVLKNPLFQKATFNTSGVISRTNPNHGFSFVGPNQTEPLHYINLINSRYWDDLRVMKCVPYENVEFLPMLTVISFTEKKVEIDCSSLTVS